MIAGRCKTPSCCEDVGVVYQEGRLRGLCGEKCLAGFYDAIRRPCRACAGLEKHIRQLEGRLEDMAMLVRRVHAENESLRAEFVKDSVQHQMEVWS